ncbi:DegT/DnrJ/EryC1/StrS family aminotransferase [Candidatus Pelagibacter sp.]|nr:DegT/DnrJ/EryC1/StrS family aminotransferase [Candidatus Pelagibacter sp.]
MKKFFLHAPTIVNNDKYYLNKTLKENWISTSGKNISLFEKKLASYTKAKYCIALNNGTSALHLSLKSINVTFGDEVIVPTITFIATINAIKYVNADPIFMDSDNFFNIDISKTISFIKNHTIFKFGYSYNKQTKKIIKAIIPVHVWGSAVLMDDLINLCKKRNIKIIEDASESLGTWYTKGKYKRKHTGTIGDAGCISFNANKIITAGAGGAVITNSSKIANNIRYLSTQAKNDQIKFIHNEIGYNYKITSLHAAIGLGQIKRINQILIKKKQIRKTYLSEMIKKKLNLNPVPDYSSNNLWMNLVNTNLNDYNELSKKIKRLSKKGIETRPVWFLNHLQKSFKTYQNYKITNSFKLINNYLCLPSGLYLSKKDIKTISKEI